MRRLVHQQPIDFFDRISFSGRMKESGIAWAKLPHFEPTTQNYPSLNLETNQRSKDENNP
jgi:hypothetical protein